MRYTHVLMRATEVLVRSGFDPKVVAKLLDIPRESVDILTKVSSMPDEIVHDFLARKLKHEDIEFLHARRDQDLLILASSRMTCRRAS